MENDNLIPKDGFYVLNDDTVPLVNRIKCARVMWVTSSFEIPNKVQSILEWGMKQVAHKQQDNNNDKITRALLWTSLNDFATSSQFEEHLKRANKNIVIRPVFVKALMERLEKIHNVQKFYGMLGICEMCVFKHGVTCAMRNNLQSIMSYYGQIVKAFVNCEWQDCNEFISLVGHVFELTNHVNSRSTQEKNIKQTFLTFLDHDFTPIIRLLAKCDQTKDKEISTHMKKLKLSVETLLRSTIFTKENEEIFTAFAKNNATQDKTFPTLHANSLSDLLAKKIKELMNDSAKGEPLVHLTRQFFTNFSQISDETIFLWFHRLLNDYVAANIQTISESETLPGLLKLMQARRIYRPTYGQIDVVAWMKKIFQCLLSSGKLSTQVCGCVITMLKIDQSIVETKLQSLLSRLIASASTHANTTLTEIAGHYVSIRQAGKLMKVLLLSLKNDTSERTNDSTDLSLFVNKVATMCVEQHSATVLLDIFCIVQSWIVKEVDTTTENLPTEWPEFVQKCLSSYLIVWCAVMRNLRILDLWNFTLNRTKLCEILHDMKKLVYERLIKKSETIKMKSILLASVLKSCILYCDVIKTLSVYALSSCNPVKTSPISLFYCSGDENADYRKFINLEEKICGAKTWKKFMRQFAISPDMSIKLAYAEWCLLKLARVQQITKLVQVLPKSKLQEGTSVSEISEECAGARNGLLENVQNLLPQHEEINNTTSKELAELLSHHISLFAHNDSNNIVQWLLNEILALDFANNKSFINDAIELCSIGITTNMLNHFKQYIETVYKDATKNEEIFNQLIKETFSSTKQLSLDQNHVKNILKSHEKVLHILNAMNIKTLTQDDANECFKLLIVMVKMASHIFPPDMASIILEPFVPVVYNSIVSEPPCLKSHKEEIENLFIMCSNVDSDKFKDLSTLLLNWILYYNDGFLDEDKFNKLLSAMRANTHITTLVTDVMVEFLMNNVDVKNMKVEVSSSHNYFVQTISKSRKRKIIQLEIPAKIRRKSDATSSAMNKLTLIAKELQKDFDESSDLIKCNNLLQCCIGLHTANSGTGCYGKNTIEIFKQKLEGIFQKIGDTKHVRRPDEIKFISLSSKLWLCEPEMRRESKKLWMRNINSLVTMNRGHNHDMKNILQNYLLSSPSKTALKNFLLNISDTLLDNFFANESLNSLQVVEVIATADWEQISQLIEKDSTAASEFLRTFVKRNMENITEIIKEISLKINHDSSIYLENFAESLKCYHKLLETKKVDFSNFELSNVFSTLHCIPFAQLAENINSGGKELEITKLEEIFTTTCEIFSHLIAQKRLVENCIPLVTMTISTLFNTVVLFGKYRVGENAKAILLSSQRCARLLERKCQSFVHNYNASIGKPTTSLISHLVVALSSQTISASVETILLDICYAFMQFLDEYSVALLKSCLPLNVRDLFRKIYDDYCKYHQFHGFV